MEYKVSIADYKEALKMSDITMYVYVQSNDKEFINVTYINMCIILYSYNKIHYLCKKIASAIHIGPILLHVNIPLHFI